jgi:hypothetical protein
VLSDDHDLDLSEPLVPCCGHAFFVDDDGCWLNINCNDGLDWTVRHVERAVTLSTQSASATISRAEWVGAIVAFCDEVEEFYRHSAPKTVSEETREGYEAFWNEWRERRAAVH